MENQNSNKILTDIFLFDEFSPEDNAMLQALYSRSPKSVTEHVEKVKQNGSGKFMEQYYVGYGHASIADCGSSTFFIEKLSIIADKAIQDWPLYSGQETSTRYVDMSKQPIIDPLNTADSKTILQSWMDFYINSQNSVKEHLSKKYPRCQDEDEKMYLKAITARTFDIMRGFLPAGITTQLSWHTNLRQAHDKLILMKHNPLPEIKNIAETMLIKLKEKYQHSFSHEIITEQEDYRESICQKYNFYNPTKPLLKFSMRTNISLNELEQYNNIIANRPLKTGLPYFLTELGNITFEFLLDYGSFRDIQRHRNGVCRIPLLTTKLGFNQWYLDQLPEDIKNKALILIEQQKQAIKNLNATQEISQYYISLGFNVACKASYGLPATVYVLELRSMKSVHPTLRQIAHKMYHAMKEKFPNLKMHADLEKDDWDVRRGLQDIEIVSKNNL
ncbi:MAG: FAD-dependent thymidylate synthase [Patescibacteria group bacterium]|nr:FAD-dependent thymidylate synthase [Patescibacteria group bacterium]MBU1870613.1 FAD-dependent thymidylate synthase [Patescibacteria group bacterium]